MIPVHNLDRVHGKGPGALSVGKISGQITPLTAIFQWLQNRDANFVSGDHAVAGLLWGDSDSTSANCASVKLVV